MFLKKSLIDLRLTSQIESGDKESKQIEEIEANQSI